MSLLDVISFVFMLGAGLILFARKKKEMKNPPKDIGENDVDPMTLEEYLMKIRRAHEEIKEEKEEVVVMSPKQSPPPPQKYTSYQPSYQPPTYKNDAEEYKVERNVRVSRGGSLVNGAKSKGDLFIIETIIQRKF